MNKFVTTQSEEMYISENMAEFYDNKMSLRVEKTEGNAMLFSILEYQTHQSFVGLGGLCLNRKQDVKLVKLLTRVLDIKNEEIN